MTDTLEIAVLARHVEVPENLQQLAVRKTERLSRYLAGVEKAQVCFSDAKVGRMRERFTCEVVIEGRGHVIRAICAAGSAAGALDGALERAELQLTRLKKRLVARSRPRHPHHSHASGPGTEAEAAS